MRDNLSGFSYSKTAEPLLSSEYLKKMDELAKIPVKGNGRIGNSYQLIYNNKQ